MTEDPKRGFKSLADFAKAVYKKEQHDISDSRLEPLENDTGVRIKIIDDRDLKIDI